MRQLGGGKLILSDYHKGNWYLGIAETMISFLVAQPYVNGVELRPHDQIGRVDYDLQQAEDDYNPEAFPEWDRLNWPSNINIRKRYAVHFGVPFEPDATWLSVPDPEPVDVVVHIPRYRRVRSDDDWARIIQGLAGLRVETLSPGHALMGSARLIAGAKVFLGCVSSCNAIAEGLGKRRFVEQAQDCYNVNVPEGHSINDWPVERVVEAVGEACK